MEKKGLAIITYNSENYFKELYNTIPFHRLDSVVVVNGGKPYEGSYGHDDKVHWIQHTENKFPAACRNEGLQALLDKGVDNLFVCEDDMLFKHEDVFDQYINASKQTGLQYLCFVSYGWGSGPVGARTPRMRGEYSPNLTINFYPNTCNEFTFRTRKMIDTVGLYDTGYNNTFDIDKIYRMSQTNMCAPFWWFADLSNSDDLIMNNPVAVSRLDGDGNRLSRLQPDYDRFFQKHGLYIQQIPQISQHDAVTKLLNIKNNKL